MPDKKKPDFFYGYVVVTAGIIASILLVGIYSSFGVFFKPLSSEFGWTRAITSAAAALATIVMGLASLVTGRLTDRFGPRVTVMVCGLLAGAGAMLMSQVTALWQLYLFYGVLLGSGMSAADVPLTATVARWFVKRRGMMIGITKVGAGLGITFGSLSASWLIAHYDWRVAYLVMGGIVLVGVVSMAQFLKRDPAQIGVLPDGEIRLKTATANSAPRQFSLKEAMNTRQFWIFAVAWFSFQFCAQSVMVHIVPHATDVGVSPPAAATIMSLIGGFSILGRLALGGLSDSFGTKKAYLIAFSLLVLALILVQFAREAWTFYLFAALYGTAHGASFALLSPTIAELFGLGSLATTLGVVLLSGTIGGLIGPMLAGWIFDIMDEYQLAFLITLALAFLALVLVSRLKPTAVKEVEHDP